MELELLFLNGKSIMVDLAEGLQAVKMKAAKVLGAPTEAVSINAGALRLTHEVSEMILMAEETLVEGPLYAVVDQDRLELAKALEGLEEDFQLLKKQSAVASEVKAAWNLRKLELPCLQDQDCHRCIRATERSLKEGVPSLSAEKALIWQLSKLQRLQSEEDKVFQERRQLWGVYNRIHTKTDEEMKKLRKDLAQEMQRIVRRRVDEVHMPPQEECEYWSPEWIEKYILKPQLALGSFDDETLRQVCPRFDRREVWTPKNRKRQKVVVSRPDQSVISSPECEQVEARTLRFRSKPKGKERRAGRLNRIRHEVDLELC